MALIFLESLLIALSTLAGKFSVIRFVYDTDFLAAQSIPDTIILCVPGQCIQGYSNVTRVSRFMSSF